MLYPNQAEAVGIRTPWADCGACGNVWKSVLGWGGHQSDVNDFPLMMN
jgi:hypothetical protein